MAALLVLAACSERPPATPATPAAPAAGAGVTAFTGARLIVGDGSVIENAVFTLGPDKHFGVVGSAAATTVPAGATRVDLAGLTVMPAIVDSHTHLSHDRAALIADLKHRAYFGVSAAAVAPYAAQGYTLLVAGVDTLYVGNGAKALLAEMRGSA